MSDAPLMKSFKYMTPHSMRLLSVGLCAGVLLGMAGAASANRAMIAAAEQEYKVARAACISGRTNQGRSTCLQEAGAALREARRGGLTSAGPAEYEKNRLLRCQNQPAESRDLCVRRMNGEGSSTGSVEGGGVLRELTVTVPAN